jgi:hypothetical protein
LSDPFYIRAYYGANKKQFDMCNVIDGDQNLTTISITEYTVTSDEASVTVAKNDNGVAYGLTRTAFSMLKDVALIYTFGKQAFTEIFTLTK